MKKDWQIKKLGEVCNIIGGTTPSTTNKSYWNGTEKWITPAEIDINKKYIFDSVRHITTQAVKDCSLQLQPKGTVIFTSRAPIGKVAISEMDFYCNQGFKNFVCSEEIFNEYLYYFLLKNVDYLNSIGKGTTFKEISKTVISQVQIPLPPLEEQKRIVAVLDKKFAQIETLKTAAEKNLQNNKQLFLAELEKAFSNKDWKIKKLEETVVPECTLGYGIVQPGDDIKNGIPVVRPVDLTTKIIQKNGLKKVLPEISDSYSRTILKGGELLICVRGTTGVVGIASKELKNCNVTRGISPLRFENDITSYFMYYCFKTKSVSDFVQEKTKGAALKQINIGDLRIVPVPLPPLEEQKRIVSHLDSLSEKVHQLEEIYTKQISDCDELKQALLAKAFEGNL